MYTYMHTYIHTYIHTYSTLSDLHSLKYTYIHTLKYTYIHTYTYIGRCMHAMLSYIHTYIFHHSNRDYYYRRPSQCNCLFGRCLLWGYLSGTGRPTHAEGAARTAIRSAVFSAYESHATREARAHIVGVGGVR